MIKYYFKYYYHYYYYCYYYYYYYYYYYSYYYLPSRITGDCDIEIAVAEGAIDTVWCFLAALYIGFQFF